MNLDFSADDQLIKDQVDKYLASRCGVDRVRAVLDAGIDSEEPYAKDV